MYGKKLDELEEQTLKTKSLTITYQDVWHGENRFLLNNSKTNDTLDSIASLGTDEKSIATLKFNDVAQKYKELPEDMSKISEATSSREKSIASHPNKIESVRNSLPSTEFLVTDTRKLSSINSKKDIR